MEEKKQLLREAIKLELNVCTLYQIYRDNFKEDREFWLQMAQEEGHHAALLDLAQDFFENFPEEILYHNLEELKKVNQNIEDTIRKYKKGLPPRQECYQYAFDLENSAFELHYQQVASQPANSDKIQMFQKINEDDKDHAQRIKALLAKEG